MSKKMMCGGCTLTPHLPSAASGSLSSKSADKRSSINPQAYLTLPKDKAERARLLNQFDLATVRGLVSYPPDWLGLSEDDRLAIAVETLLGITADAATGNGAVDAFCREANLKSQLGPIQERRHFKPLYRSPKHPRPTIRNLIYHVCPLASNDVWIKNVRQLRKREATFNGKKVIAIATGKELLPVERVKEQFGGGYEFLVLPNDPVLREQATFLPLLISVADESETTATFYAHTKGNSLGTTGWTERDRRGSTYWRNTGYHHLLDRVGECMEEMETRPAVGINQICWPLGQQPYPSGLHHGEWMFAGTFFWFRHDRIFADPRWRYVPADRYGVEAWLSGMLHRSEVASVYQPWPPADPYVRLTKSPYDPDWYQGADRIEDDE